MALYIESRTNHIDQLHSSILADTAPPLNMANSPWSVLKEKFMNAALAFQTQIFHQPFALSSADLHSMGSSLLGYLEMKVHDEITTGNHNKIVVVGNYDRHRSMISAKEKTGKLFNFQRPTAALSTDGETLFIKCYPSRDYVRHYASLIKSHLLLQERQINVEYVLPSEEECWDCLKASNLPAAPLNDIAILGYGLDALGDNITWSESTPFRFAEIPLKSGTATLIGCEHSIWSDAGGRVVYMLGKMGFKKLIYLGKVGGLKENILPNTYLATGSLSFVEGELIRWKNLFAEVEDESVIHGLHVNSPSVIFETKEWVRNNACIYDFVDPEIGQMAKYAESSKIQFSYLHIISNNLVKEYDEDLSNERDEGVLNKRKHLLKNKVRGIISRL